MTIGPVQLVVLGFVHPDFRREIVTELRRLREIGTIAVIDAQAIYKDARGNIEIEHLSTLEPAERAAMDGRIAALVGLSVDAEQSTGRAAAGIGSDATQVFTDEPAWELLDAIPNDSAAAVLLLEHRWAIPLRDAVARAGGFRIDDAFVSPLDLVHIGLLSEEEAAVLQDLERGGAAGGWPPGG